MPRVLNKRTDKIPPDAVYVGRPSRWGNPFKITREHSRQDVIEQYREWIMSDYENAKKLRERLSELKGKDLVCWCSPLPCHADVLLALANKEAHHD